MRVAGCGAGGEGGTGCGRTFFVVENSVAGLGRKIE